MQKLFYFLFIFFPLLAYGQGQTKLDSLHQQGVEQLSSLSVTQDSVQLKKDLDSLQQFTHSLDTLQFTQTLDSLKQIRSSLDTLKLKQSLDSIQSLKLPIEVAQAKADSIRGLLDVSAEANQKIKELNQRLNQPLEGSQQSIQQKVDNVAKLEGVNQQALGDLKEQTGVDISTDLPKVEGVSIEGVKGEGLPGAELPTGELPVANLPKVDLPKIDLPEAKLPKVEGVDQVEEIGGEIGEVSTKIKEYSEDVSEVAEGKLHEVENADKLAEEQLMKKEEMGILQQQEGEALRSGKDLQQLGDEDFVKQEVQQEAIKVAVDHFAGHKDKLNQARQKLMKYKGRYTEIKSLKDLPKNPLKRNPLKGKPWPERIVLGSIWSFSKGEEFKMDVGPSLAYRIYDKLELGLAYQWRLTIDKQAPLFLSTKEPLSGYSLFMDYKLRKGFFVRGTFACLNTVPANYLPVAQEQPERMWMGSYEVGLGKSYTFYKSIKGFSLMQYSFSSGPFKPYASSLQGKIGFYINGKHLYKPGKKNEPPKNEK